MKKGPLVVLIILIIIVALLAVWLLYPNSGYQSFTNAPGSTSTSTGVPTSTTPTSTSPAAFDQTLSNGTITLAYPSADFGLATTQAQILVQSSIPPCDQNFNYCLYYQGTAYQNTNFDSAGLRIEKRTTLITQAQCLNTQPSGYTGLKPTIATSTDYAVSVFSGLQNGAAGHIAAGALYRLSYKNSCYEFETRVGQSEFGNYPSGTMQELTAANQTALQSELGQILKTLTIASSGEKVAFPNL